MRSLFIWLGAACALGLLNWAIWQKETILAEGETVYLKLAPVDPRSLMQGDYMVLRYALSGELKPDQLEPVGGRLVVQIDETQVARLARTDDGSELAENERYLSYKNRRGPKFGIESFFFQEGTADQYADAEYAEIRLNQDGGAMLVGLLKAPPDSMAK